jgi:hypothetical protein
MFVKTNASANECQVVNKQRQSAHRYLTNLPHFAAESMASATINPQVITVLGPGEYFTTSFLTFDLSFGLLQ